MIFDNFIEPLAEELRQYFERMISQLGSIAENTERELVREQRVTVRASAVYDATFNAEVEIQAPLGSSLEIETWGVSAGLGDIMAVFLNTRSNENRLIRFNNEEQIGGMGEKIYLHDGEKAIFHFFNGEVDERAAVIAQCKRYTEEPGA